MIQKIEQASNNVAAFKLIGEITKEDFDTVVIPAVEELVDKIDKVNLVYVLDTDISNFTALAWFKDAQLGLQNLMNWNRAAIVTSSSAIRTFTDAFSKVMPGTFRGFTKEEEQKAIDWATEKIEID